MSIRRILGSLAATAVMGAAVAAVGVSAPAQALTRGPFTVTQANTAAKPATHTYGPIPGFWAPSRDAVTWTPGGCESAAVGPPVDPGGPALWACDVVLFDVVPPNVDDKTDWYIDIEVSWPDPTGTNDLDVTLYDDQQVARRGNSSGWTQMGESATLANPERIRTWLPTLGRYSLVVLNYLGINTSYTVKISMGVGERFVDPIEALEDLSGVTDSSTDPAPPADSGPSDFSAFENFGPPADFSGLEQLTASFDGDFGAGDLTASAGISDLPPAPPAFTAGRIVADRPGPASGAMMFLWLVVVPAALVGGGATYILSRARRGAAGFA